MQEHYIKSIICDQTEILIVKVIKKTFFISINFCNNYKY